MSSALSVSRQQQVSVFRALGDSTRLTILDFLATQPACVCEIQKVLDDMAPNLLSHHLKVLREAGLIEGTRRGRWVDYRLNSQALADVRASLPG